MPQSLHRELHIRPSQIRVRLPGIQLDSPFRIRTSHRPKSAHISDVKLLGLPREKPLPDLLGKPLGVRRCPERLFRHDA